MTPHGRRSAIAAATALCLGAYYVVTMGRDLSWFDSAELAMTSVQLGLPHPPGEPLYTMLGALLVRLWPGAPLVACNLLSAIPGALCAFFAFRVADRLGADRAPWPLVSAAVLAVGVQATVWDQCSRVEVYALATMLVLATIWLALPAIEPASVEDDPSQGLGRARWLLVGALSAAGAGVNPVIALLAVVGVVLALVPVARRRPRAVAVALAWAALSGTAVVLALYAYLPLVGGARDRFVWGAPTSLARLAFFLTGKDFPQAPFSHPGMTPLALLGAHVSTFVAWSTEVGLAGVLLLGALGLALARRWRFLVLALPVQAGGLAFGLGYEPYLPTVPDLGGYLMAGAWLLGVGLVLLCAVVARARPRLGIGLAVALWAVTAISGGGITGRDRSGHHLARELSVRFLEGVPEGAIALVESDHLAFPLLYLQQVERVRTDVVLVPTGLASSSWFWEQLHARHPTLRPLPPARERWGRLAGFAHAQEGRAVVVESLAMASRLGIRGAVCPRTVGFVLGRSCPDEPTERLAALVAGGMDALPPFEAIDRDVLAFVAAAQAEGFLALGQGGPALRLYRSSAPPRVRATLPLPDGPLAGSLQLPRLPPAWLDRPSRNLARGAFLLAQSGHADLAAAWQRAAAD